MAHDNFYTHSTWPRRPDAKNKNVCFLPHHIRTRNVHSATFACTVPNWTDNTKSINLVEISVLNKRIVLIQIFNLRLIQFVIVVVKDRQHVRLG